MTANGSANRINHFGINFLIPGMRRTPWAIRLLIVTLVGVFAVFIVVLTLLKPVSRSDMTTLPSNGRAAEDSTTSGGTVDSAVAPKPTIFVRRLDGIIVSSQAAADILPFGVMIENQPSTRPQSSLSKARVVYEALAEGGVTRCLAIFLPEPDITKIGPVRSARHYYIDWIEEYGCTYVHAGGSPNGLAQIQRDNVPALNGVGPDAKYFWRERIIAAPHNLFTSHALLAQGIADKQYPTVATFEPWTYNDIIDPSFPVSNGQSVNIDFSGPTYLARYEYDPTSKQYQRFHGQQVHLDRETGQQISADNVVVEFVPRPSSLGEKGRIDIEVLGQGRALLFRDGQRLEGIWRKKSPWSRTTFEFPDGRPLPFKPGKTWIAVVPEDRPVDAQ